MTKAIIFDLDSCLAAADEVGEQLFAPAFAAIRAANGVRVEATPRRLVWRATPRRRFAAFNQTVPENLRRRRRIYPVATRRRRYDLPPQLHRSG